MEFGQRHIVGVSTRLDSIFFEREGGGWVGFFGNGHELSICILTHKKNHVNGYYSEKVVVYDGRKTISCKCLHTKLDVLAYKLNSVQARDDSVQEDIIHRVPPSPANNTRTRASI